MMPTTFLTALTRGARRRYALLSSRLRTARQRPASRSRSARLGLEHLEDRLVPAVFNVNSLADILNPGPGVVTLRSAIQAANATPGGNTINLTLPGTYMITLPGTPGEADNAAGEFAILPTGGNLTIQNTSGGTVVVDGNHLSRVFDINPNFNPATPTPPFTVTMQGFTIQNGLATDPANPDGPFASGGGIRDVGNASLMLTNVVLTNNTATADGGGVSFENTVSVPWTFTVNNSLISNNHAGDAGGGIDADGSGRIFINTGTVITGNTSVNQGAGIWLDAIQAGTVFATSNLTVTGTIISNNTAIAPANFGGGIGNAGNGIVTIIGSTIESNFSGGVGGGFADENAQGTLIVQNSYFLGNSSFGNGGAIAVSSPTTSISSSEIKGNSSGGFGGGIFANGLTLTVLDTTLAGNTASGAGGGIELATTGTGAFASTIDFTTITGNSALNNAGANGGGIDAPAAFTGAVSLFNDTINANIATTGGGIFWQGTPGSTFTVQNTIIARNSATTGPDAFNMMTNPFTDHGGNLIGIAGIGSGNFGFTAATTQTGTFASPLDPRLGPLQNNGGPTVGFAGPTAVLQSLVLETEALLPGSPAIGRGTPSAATITDERGFQLMAGAAVDVGTFQTGATPVTTPNQRYIASIYQTLLGRAPDPSAIAWVNLLNQGVAPAAVVLAIEASLEFRLDEVQTIYQRFLHRAADPGGLAIFSNALGAGATVEQVEEIVIGSQEYFQLNGSTNAGFLTGLYRDVLNRSPDAGGLFAFTQALQAGLSRSAVAAVLFGSQEFRNDLVALDYQTDLGRNADPAGAAGFVLALNSGATDQAVLAAILGSPEAFARRT
ncbi:MAG TPA: DUF4214 domain-containing protein [Gemmataceae bacterium]|nr:DUF4214 domain-containing protein [Gemmataceae bacterium]